MALILPGNVASATAAAGYDVDNSCRFNSADNAYMGKTSGANGTATSGTFSCWVKRGNLGVTSSVMSQVEDGNNFMILRFTSGDALDLRWADGGTSTSINLTTTRLFRDPSAWMNIVVKFLTSDGTAANRVKIYINGVQETSFSSTEYPAENEVLYGNVSSGVFRIGDNGFAASGEDFDGYIAEVVWLDNTSTTASDFGEFDEDSPTIWKPKDVSGLTFGTNGFYLDFEASDNLGNDANGGTDLTEVNLAATDQASDSPTNNFCTMNPLQAGSYGTLSEGNLTWLGNTATNQGNVYPTIYSDGSGKWYWEVKIEANDGVNYPVVGLAGDVGNRAFGILNGGSDAQGFYTSSTDVYWNWDTTTIYSPDGNVTGVTAYDDDDIIIFALDRDNGEFYMGRNGTWLNSGDPTSGATGTGSILSFTASGTAQSVLLSTYNASQLSANFGNPAYANSSDAADANGYGAFEYAPPSGYFALCTKNLAEYG